MVADAEGFVYAEVDLAACTGCGICRTVCPVLGARDDYAEPVAHACRALDDTVRMASTSGGVFGLIAGQVLDEGGVVFGAAFDEGLSVAHRYVETRDGLGQLQGSKYVQSEIGPAYDQVASFLGSGRRVLFCGTPCQVAGLSSFLGDHPPELLTVDFVCLGVPSPLVWRRYVTEREEQSGARVVATSFRDKSEGWRTYSAALRFEDGSEYRRVLGADPYIKALRTTVSLRPSCYECRFKGLGRGSDITLADFWGVERVCPELDDDRGTSLVLVQSDRGQRALEGVSHLMESRQVPADVAVAANPSATGSAPRNPRREAFFGDLERLPFDRLVARYCTPGLVERVRGRIARAAGGRGARG